MGTETLINTFGRLQKRLHTVACRLLRDEMEAEDAVQDTFCNLWSARLPETSEEARYRLFAVLKNVCLNKLKRQYPMTGLDMCDSLACQPECNESEQIRQYVMASLTPVQKEIFRLAVFEEMEYEEIALRLGMSIDAVRMSLCRARKKAREKYKLL